MPRTVVMAETSDLYHDYRVQKEASSLAAAGYDVRVYGFRSSLTPPPGGAFAFQLRTFPVVPRKHRRLRNLSIMVYVAVINVLLLLERRDFYHAHNTMFLFGMHLASRLHRGAFVYDAHEVQWEQGRVQEALEKAYIHRAQGLINVSTGRVRACSERYGVPEDRFTVISNYPIVDGLRRNNKRTGTDDISLVFSGGFNLDNNRLDLLLEAMARVPGIELNLMAFGYRDAREKLESIIAREGLGHRARFIPLVSPDQVMAAVARFDVAVNLLTNPKNHISIRYCSTNKMYEYLAAGMPVLCSDLDAFLEEFVEPGAAFAVDPNDIDDIERGLRLLVQERERLPAMSEKAAWLARNRFNWETQERRLLELYDSLARSDS